MISGLLEQRSKIGEQREINGMQEQSQIVATSEAVSVDLSSNGTECVVILSLGDGVYYEIQGVGAKVWEMVQNPRSFREILDAILEEYDVEAERCRADLTTLIHELQDRGLIESR